MVEMLKVEPGSATFCKKEENPTWKLIGKFTELRVH